MTRMKRYIIKKTVLANSIKEAIRNEKDASVEGVYQDYNYIHPVKNKIGFESNARRKMGK